MHLLKKVSFFVCMSSDHSRRLAFDTPSGSRKSARTSIDSTSGSTLRSSYLEHPLDTCQNPSYDAPPINEPTEISRYHEGRDSQNNFRYVLRFNEILICIPKK